MAAHAYVHVCKYCGFGCILTRHDAAALFAVAGNQAGQNTVHFADGSRQRKLSHEHAVLEARSVNLSRGRKYADGNREVKTAAGLGQICRSQIDSDATLREFELRI